MEEKEKRYRVNLTKIYNASIVVMATSADKAVNYVSDNMDTLVKNEDFNFGETTADFAELEEEE